MATSPFALNHTSAPALHPDAFFALARRLGLSQVEIRNDIAGNATLDGTAPESVRAEAARHGVSILSINGLQRFNDWNPERAREARELADYARACGAAALVLVPVNDTGWQPREKERLAGLRTALAALAPILGEAGIAGLVEPLGFVECSLRLKQEALDAIDALALGGRFRLVHDTFHHFLSGETVLFPHRTGLVHLSGVEDRSVPLEKIRDEHRVLIGPADLLGNVAQIRALRAGGYGGPLSFEPFSPVVQASATLEADLAASLAHVAGALG